jgi:hypothetical protein
VIAASDFSNSLTHCSYDAGAFMSEDERGFRGPVAACGMQIAVTHAGRFYFDKYFSGMRRIELSLLDYQRSSLFPQDCSVDLHQSNFATKKHKRLKNLDHGQVRCHVRQQLDALIERCETSVVCLASMISIEDLL